MRFKNPFIVLSLLLLIIFPLIQSCTPETEYGSRSFEDKSREIFILNNLAETVSVLHPDTQTLYNNVFLTGAVPNDMLFYNDQLFIVCSTDNTIQVVNESTFENTDNIYLGAGKNPYSIITGSASEPTTAFVPNYVDNSISVINLATLELTATLKDDAFSLNRPQDGTVVGDYLYICNSANTGSTIGDGSVSVFSAVSPYSYIGSYATGTGSNPQTCLGFPSADELHVYLSGGQSDDDGEILVLDISTPASPASISEITRLAVGGSPAYNTGAYNSDTGFVYLTGTYGLDYYDAATPSLPADHHLKSLSNPQTDLYAGAVYDSSTGLLVVANFGGDSIMLLDTQNSYSQVDLSASDGPQTPYLVVE